MNIVNRCLLVAEMHVAFDGIEAHVVLTFIYEAELLKAINEALGAGFCEVFREVVVVCKEGPGALVREEGYERGFCCGEGGIGVRFEFRPEAVADDGVGADVAEDGRVGRVKYFCDVFEMLVGDFGPIAGLVVEQSL